MWIVQLSVRNALRNVRRSLLTAGTVIIGVAMYVLISSFIVGMFGNIFEESTLYIGHVRVADPDFIEREQLQPLYEYVPDAAGVAAAIERDVEGARAYPIIKTGMLVSVDDTIGDVFTLATGVDEAWLTDEAGFREQLVAGEWPDFAAGELLVGQRTAEQAGASVGDSLLLFGSTQDGAMSPMSGKVAGIVASGLPAIDKQVFASLQSLQYTLDIEDGALEVLVYGDDLHDDVALAAAIEGVPEAAGLQIQPWSRRSPFDLSLGMTSVIQGLLVAILVFITALAIWNTMTMSVLERTSEIGVMRAMGLGRATAVAMFVVEALVIASVGGLIGLAVGSIPALALEHYGLNLGGDLIDTMDTGDLAMSARMYGDLTVSMLVQGYFVGLIMAVVGSFIPSLRAASISPVTAMQGAHR